MKILLVTSLYYPYIGGGAHISNKLLVEGIEKEGIDVEVFTLGEEEKVEVINDIKINRLYLNKITKNFLKRVREKNNKLEVLEKVRLVYINNFHFYNIYIYIKFKNILANYSKETILHTSDMPMFYQILWWKAAKKNNLKVIHTLRTDFFISKFFPNRKSNFFIKLMSNLKILIFKYYSERYIDCVHSPSRYLLELHEKRGYKFKKTKVIPNTININNINPIKKEIEVMYIGRLTQEKGIMTLVKALKEMNLISKSLFIGDGILKDELLNVGCNITGWLTQEKVFEYMKKAKVIILPSEWEEAFGRVLIEGVANGTLVIGSDMGAIPEVLNYDKRYIFKTKDTNELKEKVKRILSLSWNEYTKEVSDLQNYFEKYNYTNHIKMFKSFYQEI